mgnify:CR=1 FL=1
MTKTFFVEPSWKTNQYISHLPLELGTQSVCLRSLAHFYVICKVVPFQSLKILNYFLCQRFGYWMFCDAHTHNLVTDVFI